MAEVIYVVREVGDTESITAFSRFNDAKTCADDLAKMHSSQYIVVAADILDENETMYLSDDFSTTEGHS